MPDELPGSWMPPVSRGHFWKGFGLGFLMQGFQILPLLVQPILMAIAGFTQLVYIIPAIIHFKKRGETDTIKGLITAAALTLLGNAACWGTFLVSMKNWH